MRRFICLLVALAGIVSFRSVLGLTPPLEENELKREANLIVIGEVGEPVICSGKPIVERNATISYYSVPFTVRRAISGNAKKGDRFNLRFRNYHYVRGFTGDADELHFPGEVGKYYLVRIDENTVRLVHWSGVKVTTPGHGTLPECTK